MVEIVTLYTDPEEHSHELIGSRKLGTFLSCALF